MSVDDAELFAILGALDASGVRFDLTPDPPRPPLVFDPPLQPEAEAALAPWLGWLAWVALGRYSRHAPTRCQRCGFVAMARVVATRAVPDEGKPAGWRVDGKCGLCSGRREVPHAPTFKRPPSRGKRPSPPS